MGQYMNVSGVNFGGTGLVGARRIRINPEAKTQFLEDDHETGIQDVLVSDILHTIEVEFSEIDNLGAIKPGTTGTFSATIHAKSLGGANATITAAANKCVLLPNNALSSAQGSLASNVLRFAILDDKLVIS